MDADAAGERRRSTERKAWWGARRRSQSRRPQESNGKHARRQHHQPSARRTAHASLDFRLAAAVPFDIRVQTSVGAWPIFVIGRDMRIAPEAFHLSTPHRLAPYCISGTVRDPLAGSECPGRAVGASLRSGCRRAAGRVSPELSANVTASRRDPTQRPAFTTARLPDVAVALSLLAIKRMLGVLIVAAEPWLCAPRSGTHNHSLRLHSFPPPPAGACAARRGAAGAILAGPFASSA